MHKDWRKVKHKKGYYRESSVHIREQGSLSQTTTHNIRDGRVKRLNLNIETFQRLFDTGYHQKTIVIAFILFDKLQLSFFGKKFFKVEKRGFNNSHLNLVHHLRE